MKFLPTIAIAGCGLFLMTTTAQAAHHDTTDTKACSYASAHKAGPYFVDLNNGDIVASPLHVKMGVLGMQVHKAGKVIDGTGHHHLIIDGGSVAEGEAVSKDAKHIHFGKGQTETDIKLSKGNHTLTLQFADGHHQSYGKVFSRTIQVIVK